MERNYIRLPNIYYKISLELEDNEIMLRTIIF
jgi:hypothetical protein